MEFHGREIESHSSYHFIATSKNISLANKYVKNHFSIHMYEILSVAETEMAVDN